MITYGFVTYEATTPLQELFRLTVLGANTTEEDKPKAAKMIADLLKTLIVIGFRT